MVGSDQTFMQLLPPASDLAEDMVHAGESLWPPPQPAWKTIPFKKKSKTKYTVVQCHDKDLYLP